MRSFYNRKLRVFSPPLLFLIILPCSPKAMIAPCKHFTRHKCQCWSAILIQEFISFVFAEVQRTVWPESRQRPPTRNIPCAHLGGAVLLMKRRNFCSKTKAGWCLTLLKSHAHDMTSMGGNGLPQASAAGSGIRIAPMRSSVSTQQDMVSTWAEVRGEIW